MRKNRVKFIIVTIITFMGASFIIGNLSRILLTLDYFKIKDIVVSEHNRRLELSYLKGKNIFTLDLERESEYIAQHYPTYRKIRLARVMPNRLFVDFIKRQPLALVKLYRYFSVDEEGVLFDVPEPGVEPDLSAATLTGNSGVLAQDRNLPFVLGLETKIFAPKVGKQYNIKELILALQVIKELRLNRALKGYRITSVNVANLSSASFFIIVPMESASYPKAPIAMGSRGLEVRFGEDGLKDKINILGVLFTQGQNELANIKYIDLRFKEPVIKFKDVK